MSEAFEVIELGGVKTVAAKSACNHVYVVDVSGSMYMELPKIRQHLKNIISVVAQPDDTFSVIYFSGRNQCGVVFENVLVSDVSTVDMMHKSIDRYLTTIGLTGFVDPLEKALTLKLDDSKLSNFIMLTDGYDNQSSRPDILIKTQALSAKYDSVSFIEYGFYADRDLLSQMAATVNGVHIFADGFKKYETIMEDVVRGVPRVQNINVKVNKKAKHGVFIYNGQIRIVEAKDGEIVIPEDVKTVHAIVPKDVLTKQLSEEHLYLILFYAAKTVDDELVWKCLQALGDVALVEKYQNAFTKQELSNFEEAVSQAVLDPTMRFLGGKNLDAVPDKYAPTILDLLEALTDSESFVVTDSPDWEYNRIGRSSSTSEALPRFIPSPMAKISLRGLVFNSERPNVSFATTLKGRVELPENDKGLPKNVPSFINRTYTIVKDGIRNMDSLPVVFPQELAAELNQFPHNEIEADDKTVYWVFDLTKIPVINRGMVESVSLKKFTSDVSKLTSYKASLKVLTQLITDNGGTNSKIAGLVDEYGEEAAKWLSEIGVRDYGFSPVGTKSNDVTDEYESIQVEYKIKGLSSLPAVSAVEKKVTEGKKLNIADTLIKQNLDHSKGLETSVLEDDKAALTVKKRALENSLARQVYSLVLGRKWFGEEEVATTDIQIDEEKTTMTVEKVRKMVKI